jgi:hypothetical protein
MNSVIHAFEVFRITDTILKDTLVTKKTRSSTNSFE